MSKKYKKKEGFVASMRLDVLVSQAFSLSRNISEKLLKSQKVFHKWKDVFIRWTKDQTGRYHIRARIWEVSGGRFRKNIKKKGRQFITLAIFQ